MAILRYLPLCIALSVTFLHAEKVLFLDSMNYADDYEIRGKWDLIDGAMPSVENKVRLSPEPLSQLRPKPDHSPFMSIANGVVSQPLTQSPRKHWTLKFLVLSSDYSRGQSIYIMDSTGKKGYGVYLNTALVDQYHGEGFVIIKKLDLPMEIAATWNGYLHGQELAKSEDTGHPITGYRVDAYEGNQDVATYHTDDWLGFMEIKLTWKSDSGQLAAYVNGELMAQAVDKDFSEFDLIVVHGNKTGYFDEIELSE